MEFDGILGLALLAAGRWLWKRMKQKNKQQESMDHNRSSNKGRNLSRESNRGFSRELQELEGTKKKLASLFRELGGELNGDSKKSEFNKAEEKRESPKDKARLERQLENTASGGGNKMQRVDLQDSQLVFNTMKKENSKEAKETGAYSIKTSKRSRLKLEFSKKAVINGIIMAEVLGKPRAL
ncbi:MAG: hypothetical protein COA82_12930 [Alkaliphilus sp.]|nr:MAG: hypothetical protein COA82_12930 [Alkaliphilus sp.]